MTKYPLTELVYKIFPPKVEEFTPTVDWFYNQYPTPGILPELTLLFGIIVIIGLIVFYIFSMLGFESKTKVCKRLYNISVIIGFGSLALAIIPMMIGLFFDGKDKKLAKQDLAQFETTVGYVNHDIESITVLGKELRVVYDNDQYVDIAFDDETQFIVEDEDTVKFRIDGYFNKEWYDHVEISEETSEKLKVPFDNLTIYLKETNND